MKIVTYQWGGQRHVGRLSADGKDVTPFQFEGKWRERASSRGALALIEMQTEGHTPLSMGAPSLPFSAITLEAPIPRPRRNNFCVGRQIHTQVDLGRGTWQTGRARQLQGLR